jgi:naphtho-gamma-pyrone polyketide synthase
MGLCTGLLAAAAVSSSQSVSQLLPTAVYTVLIALRVGLCALRTGVLIDPTAKSQDSWSVVVMKIGIDEAQDIVTHFCSEKVIT